MSTAAFLDPEHYAPIRNLDLRAKLIVEGMIAGLHKSPYHGFSAEFLEYRPYRSGEAARAIDWRKYAKTDRSFVRLFEDETNCPVHILIDKSASMAFRSEALMSKFEYARTLAASIAWILIRQRDAVALAVFDEKVETYLPPRSTNLQLKNIIGILDKTETGAPTRCGKSIERLATGIRRRGMTVVISDLFDDPGAIIQGIRHLRFKRQDILLLWVLDPGERNFPEDRSYVLQDMETGGTLRLDGHTAARFQRDGMERHRELIGRGCRELKADFFILQTDEPFVRALMRVVQTRRRSM